MDALAKLKTIANLEATDPWPADVCNQNLPFWGLPEMCKEIVVEMERLRKLEHRWNSALRF